MVASAWAGFAKCLGARTGPVSQTNATETYMGHEVWEMAVNILHRCVLTKSNISPVFTVLESWDGSDLEGWLSVRVRDLRGRLEVV